MALTPYTRQEEWYQQMINASTGNYLPSITAQDEGKVLTVENDGSWGVENVPSELPAVTASDRDKFLHTNDSTGAVEWADAPDGLPAVTDVDEGKVLTVNNSGVWVAQTPASGGGVLVVTFNEKYNAGVVPMHTCDHTLAEIDEAVAEGKTLMAVFVDQNDITVGSFLVLMAVDAGYSCTTPLYLNNSDHTCMATIDYVIVDNNPVVYIDVIDLDE